LKNFQGLTMKKAMSGLDIKICLEELKEKIGGSWVGKIYEFDGTFLIRLNTSDRDVRGLIIEPGNRIHITYMKHPTPQRPPSFPMLLRKYLSNTKLVGINQPDLERVVELKFEKKDESYLLMAELFGEGNLILSKEDGEIIQPYKDKIWKDRKIKSGKKYSLPPRKGESISSISKSKLKSILEESPDLVRGLARNLSIGGELAEEICERSDIEKDTATKKLTDRNYEEIFLSIESLFESEISPRIVYEDGKPTNVTPFPLRILEGSEFESFESFNKALDEYFRKISKKVAEEEKEGKLERKKDRIKARLEEQKENLREIEKKIKTTKEKADAISKHHKTIDIILDRTNKLRKSESWGSVREEIQKSENSKKRWAKPIKSISPETGKIKLKLPETTVELDLRKSAFNNASKFYERNKKLKSKVKGAKKAIKKTEKELQELEEEKIKIESRSHVPKKRRQRKWFERFKWFYSSQNLLVIAGRDSTTNKEAVEKHMDPKDRYLHADLKGAPHTIIKSEGEKITDQTTEEAARFSAIHSRAWKEGLANVEVYWVNPDQVSKEAPSGEYLPKGGYMIKGKRNYLTVPLEAAIGLKEIDSYEVPMCGPPTAINAHSEILMRIKPGSTKKSEIADKIKEELENNLDREINLDRLMQMLPPGPAMIIN